MGYKYKEYDAMYKCRMCGKVFAGSGTTGKDVMDRCIMEYCTTGDFKDSMISKYSIHSCEKNKMGIADFIGYKIKKVKI